MSERTDTTAQEDGFEEGNYSFSCPVDHDGTFLQIRGWTVEHAKNQRPLLLVHDWGEDSTIFGSLGRHLNSHDYSCYAYDLRGHGLSGESWTKSPSFAQHLQDLLQVVSWLKHENKGQTVEIVAQGMSALMLLHFIKTFPKLLSRSLMVAPALGLQAKQAPWRRFVMRAISDVAPRITLPRALSPQITVPSSYTRPTTIIQTLMAAGGQPPLSAGMLMQTLEAMNQGRKILLEKELFPLTLWIPEQSSVYDYSFLKTSDSLTQKLRDSIQWFPSPQIHLAESLLEGGDKTVGENFLLWLNLHG